MLGDRGLVQSYHLWKKRGELKKQIEIRSVQLQELEKNLALHQKSERMLEKVARENQMSKNDEHIFIFRAAKE